MARILGKLGRRSAERFVLGCGYMSECNSGCGPVVGSCSTLTVPGAGRTPGSFGVCFHLRRTKRDSPSLSHSWSRKASTSTAYAHEHKWTSGRSPSCDRACMTAYTKLLSLIVFTSFFLFPFVVVLCFMLLFVCCVCA